MVTTRTYKPAAAAAAAILVLDLFRSVSPGCLVFSLLRARDCFGCLAQQREKEILKLEEDLRGKIDEERDMKAQLERNDRYRRYLQVRGTAQTYGMSLTLENVCGGGGSSASPSRCRYSEMHLELFFGPFCIWGIQPDSA